MLHPTLQSITYTIKERSRPYREHYLALCQQQENKRRQRPLSCGNIAHACAVMNKEDKSKLIRGATPNIGIISAYNDVLSAHHTYKYMPDLLLKTIEEAGATGQFAAGVPAMCDGVTQGQAGMELSLFSRDVIALSTAIALSHHIFDGVLCLGICDKIVPGMLIGALRFGHLPVIFVPGGPMPSGLSNKEKIKAREDYARGVIDKNALQEAECASYHSPGTCTFYGTANSNQILMEFLGLHLAGASFYPPNSDDRLQATEQAASLIVENARKTPETALYHVVTEESIVNAVVGLMATGGSTNHTIHLIAIARAAGIRLSWEDMAAISDIIPLLTKIYPNGEADINHFHQAGGCVALISELLDQGLLHDNVVTITGEGLEDYRQFSVKQNTPIIPPTPNQSIIRSVDNPFLATGGLKHVKGNLGEAVIKISAIASDQQNLTLPAKIFDSPQDLVNQYQQGLLKQDFIAVILGQGPKVNGMPELHQLTPILSNLQKEGFKVALLTDGRLSGASAKIAAAIHLCPEGKDNPIARSINDQDPITIDACNGILHLNVTEKELQSRIPREIENPSMTYGLGRELFSAMRQSVTDAKNGASFIISNAMDAHE